MYITALGMVFFYACSAYAGLGIWQRRFCASHTIPEEEMPFTTVQEVKWSYGEEKGEAIMERSCSHCDNPDSSLLRIVLIGEIIRADEVTLYTMAEIFQTLGLVELSQEDDQEDDVAEVEQVAQEKTRLRLVK
jgi:hypothetical protein